MFVTDDLGYLLNARHISGAGEAVYHLFSPFYYGGYSLLIAPVFVFAGSPHEAFAAVQLVNILLGVALVVPLYLLARYPFEASQGTALIVSTAAALYTGVAVQVGVAWSENLLPVLASWLLVGVARLRTSPLGAPLLVGLTSGALTATHPRFLPLAAIVAVGLTIGLVRRTIDLRCWTLVAASGVLVAAFGRYLNEELQSTVYTVGGYTNVSQTGAIWSGLSDPSSYPVALSILSGQIWYLAVATAGIFLVALCQLLRCVLGADIERPAPVWSDRQRTALLMLGGLATLLGLSAALFMGMDLDAARADHVAYGRYCDPLVPSLLVVGLLYLSTATRLITTRVGLAVSSITVLATVWTLAGPQSDILTERFVWPVAMPGVLVAGPFVHDSFFAFRPLEPTLWALGFAAVLVVLARYRMQLAVLAVTISFISSSLITATIVGTFVDNQVKEITLPVAINALEGVPGPVSYDVASHSPYGLSAYQFQTPGREFLIFDSRVGELPPSRIVIASVHEPPSSDADHLVARESSRDQGLWLLDGLQE